MSRFDTHQSSKLTFAESASPGTPASGLGYLYVATDGTIHFVNDAGTDTELGSGGGVADQGTVTYFDLTEAAAPATPASGKVRWYAKTDGSIASKDDAGAETVHGAGGGGGGGSSTGGDLYLVENYT